MNIKSTNKNKNTTMLRISSKARTMTATTTITTRRQTKLFVMTAAAAALSSSSHAWTMMIPPTTTTTNSRNFMTRPTVMDSTSSSSSSTRLYSSWNNNNKNNKNDDNGILSKIGKTVKSFLPTKWFGTDEEKQKLQRRQQIKEEVNGGLDQLFKDAPLGLRMMGKMISPLMSTVASTMAETMAEQQRTTEALLDDAQMYLENDSAVRDLLGSNINVGTPFQQSSSTMSINGQTQSRVELAFPVNGSRGSGVARVSASSQDGISQLLLEAGGRLLTVNLNSKNNKWTTKSSSTIGGKSASSSSSSRRRRGGGGGGDDDDIIEAEIIEKKSTK